MIGRRHGDERISVPRVVGSVCTESPGIASGYEEVALRRPVRLADVNIAGEGEVGVVGRLLGKVGVPGVVIHFRGQGPDPRFLSSGD